MRALLLLLVLLGMAEVGWGQRFERDTICGTDTIGYLANHKKQRHWIQTDLPMYSPKYYKRCQSKSNYAIRFEPLTVSIFDFNGALNGLTGNRTTMFVGASFIRKNAFLRYTYNVISIKTLEDLSMVNGGVLNSESTVNFFSSSLFLGYDFKLGNNFSIEPALGVSNNGFNVIKQEGFENAFSTSYGVKPSLTLNKYFGNINKNLWQYFFRVSHGFVDFGNSYSGFGKNYWEFSSGVSWTIYFDKKFFLLN